MLHKLESLGRRSDSVLLLEWLFSGSPTGPFVSPSGVLSFSWPLLPAVTVWTPQRHNRSVLLSYRHFGGGNDYLKHVSEYWLLENLHKSRSEVFFNGSVKLTWMSLGMTSVPFLVLCAAAALLTYFFSRKKVTSQLMKATRGARYWSLVQKVLSLFLVTGTYRGFGLWWGRSSWATEKNEGNKRQRMRFKDKESKHQLQDNKIKDKNIKNLVFRNRTCTLYM